MYYYKTDSGIQESTAEIKGLSLATRADLEAERIIDAEGEKGEGIYSVYDIDNRIIAPVPYEYMTEAEKADHDSQINRS